eukprot:scaffold141656_cov19-Tisochrysis_lutea.AAC.2
MCSEQQNGQQAFDERDDSGKCIILHVEACAHGAACPLGLCCQGANEKRAMCKEAHQKFISIGPSVMSIPPAGLMMLHASAASHSPSAAQIAAGLFAKLNCR